MDNPEPKPFYTPTPDQLVPDPPPGLTQRQKIAFYTQDLRMAIGPEFMEAAPSPARAQPPRYRYRLDYEKRFPVEPKGIPPDLDAMERFLSEITRPK